MDAASTRGKRVLRFVSIGVVLAAVAVVASSYLMRDQRPEAFVSHWASLFEKCSDVAAIRALPAAERPDCIYIREFTNGQWVAVTMEHACCSGAGFNGSVFFDNTRTIRYDTTHSFCGYEGLCGELGNVQAKNLAEFYASLTKLTLKIWKQQPGQPVPQRGAM